MSFFIVSHDEDLQFVIAFSIVVQYLNSEGALSNKKDGA